VVLRPSGTAGREDSDRAAVAYVDNYACLSSVEAVAQKGRDAITSALEGAGLVVHDLQDAARDAVFTGVELDSGRLLRVKRRHTGRLASALEELLDRNHASGTMLQVIVGHYT